jgi:hypothetical protein
MKKRPIIIHVPKTGGTTLFMAISGSPKPPNPNRLYRHIQMFGDNEEMKSNCGDIFDCDTNSNYVDQQLILMVRNPLERIESEFGFLGNREMFRELWQNSVGSEYPKTLLDYIKHPSNANSICRFLLGIPMYIDATISQLQFDSIITSFDKIPFVFGRTDRMAETIANVSYQCGIEFGNTIPRYRTSLYKPKRDNWGETTTNFNELNSFDNMLIEAIHTRFENQFQNIPNAKIVTFEGDEYDSVYPFVCANKMRSPLEIYANDLKNPQLLYDWLNENKELLEPLLKNCLQNNNGDGKAFLIEWLASTIPLLLQGQKLDIDREDPLQTLRNLVAEKFIA